MADNSNNNCTSNNNGGSGRPEDPIIIGSPEAGRGGSAPGGIRRGGIRGERGNDAIRDAFLSAAPQAANASGPPTGPWRGTWPRGRGGPMAQGGRGWHGHGRGGRGADIRHQPYDRPPYDAGFFATGSAEADGPGFMTFQVDRQAMNQLLAASSTVSGGDIVTGMLFTGRSRRDPVLDRRGGYRAIRQKITGEKSMAQKGEAQKKYDTLRKKKRAIRKKKLDERKDKEDNEDEEKGKANSTTDASTSL